MEYLTLRLTTVGVQTVPVQALDAMGIAVRGGDLASLPLLKRMGVTAAVRASCYAYTRAEEVDLLVAAPQKESRGFS